MVMLLSLVFLGLLAFSSSVTDTLRELRRIGEYRKACPKFGNAVQPSNRVFTKQRVEKLRQIMSNTTITRDQRLLDAYFIPYGDDHNSDYIEEHDMRLRFISGFSGSYGEAIITRNSSRVTEPKAALWTDGRYHLQADNEIDCGWRLMRIGFSNVPNASQWLHEQAPMGGVLGVDPKLLTETRWRQLNHELRRINWQLVDVHVNLVDVIWTSQDGRPPRRNKNVFVLDESFSGRRLADKTRTLRNILRSYRADAMVVTALDEIAWLLNIRGRDIPYTPVVRSYLLIDMNRIRFYVNESQLIAKNIYKYFRNSSEVIEVIDYDLTCSDLSSLSQTYSRILIPCKTTSSASHYITSCIPDPKQRLCRQSPIILLKTEKNPTEIKGMQMAHIRDAAAMCEFFAYFDQMDGSSFTELDLVRIIDQFRYEQLNSLGNSFPTIAGFGSNGAMPHYVPTTSTNVNVTAQSTLVLDSGGQYLDGTTDITRTLHFGQPTDLQIEAYTRVLLGQIQTAMLTFPRGLTTSAIDVMARAPLWDVGENFKHGTGHGIGSFLNVHEEPINQYYEAFGHPENLVLQPGYFLSNEPGFYVEGDFGIRLENVLQVIRKSWLSSDNDITYLGFRVISLVPYEPKLIDLKLLSRQQIRWLNEFNDKIRIHVGAELKKQNFTKGFYWMMEKTHHFPESASLKLEINLFIFCTNLFAFLLFRY